MNSHNETVETLYRDHSDRLFRYAQGGNQEEAREDRGQDLQGA